MTTLDVDAILRAFEGPEPPREEQPPGLASVLLPLYVHADDGPSLLYIRRADHLRAHPGEISFPGGRVEPGEAPRDAALREAHEEVGIPPARVERVQHIVDYLTYRGNTVCAYVGRATGDPPTEPHSRDEVADVFLVPLRDLLDPANYEARRVDGMPEGGRVHYWRVGRRVMWGITGELTAQFLTRACGWTLPHNVRTISDVSEFVPGP